MAQPTPSVETTDAITTPRLFWWMLGICTVLAMLPTLVIELDLRAARLFFEGGAMQDAVQWWWVEWINGYVPAAFRLLVFLSLGLWIVSYLPVARIRHWRRALAFLVLAGALGPGLIVNSGFKDNWQRARPYQVQDFGGTQQFTRATVMTDQCNNNCSFVSGHVACGFFFVSCMLLRPRRDKLWAGIGLAAGWTIGFARMADRAHWLSDVLWAAPITLVSSWIVWRLVLRIYPFSPHIQPSHPSPAASG